MNEQTAPNFGQKLLKQCKIVPFFKKLKEGQNRGKMPQLPIAPKKNLKIGTFISFKTRHNYYSIRKKALHNTYYIVLIKIDK